MNDGHAPDRAALVRSGVGFGVNKCVTGVQSCLLISVRIFEGDDMGRSNGKRTTANLRALDVRQLQRDQLLTPGQSFGWNWTRNGATLATINLSVQFDCVILDFRQREYGGEWQDRKYPVRLDWTRCNYGGQRAWWLCPAAGCGRRVAILYSGSGLYACRHCHRLAYASQRKTPDDLAAMRANKLRKRMGWNGGILNDNGGKPKGMHWRTYWGLRAAYEIKLSHALAGFGRQLSAIDARLGKCVV